MTTTEPPGTTGAVAIDQSVWSQALALLRTARRAVLVCHVAPDGDALGSMLALARVLRSGGTDVTCTWGDASWSVPTTYRWLPGIDEVVRPEDVAGDADLLVVLDTASRDRLGVLGRLADRVPQLLVIDHHAHNSGLAGVQLVDPGAAATAVIVEELLRRLDVAVDPTTATLLYVGLVTDTGSFQHSVTTPAVHGVAARLLRDGVRPAEVAQRLWADRSFGYVKVLGAALARVRLEAEAAGGRGWVWTWTTYGDLADAGVGLDEIESVIEVVRATREADVAAVFKQDADGSFRVSLRSRGATDVGAVCSALGGGGHRLAAGFTSTADAEVTAARLRDLLSDAPRP